MCFKKSSLLGGAIDDGEVACVIRSSLEGLSSTPESLVTVPCGVNISCPLTILS